MTVSSRLQKIIRRHRTAVLLRCSPSKPRGRGAKFQWNTGTEYRIEGTGRPVMKFKTLAEAEKEWIFVILRG